ncbi:predicted protein [Nematostella vectensis]|uniref:DUF885 domain-containing protein n=1 Tax=Nematostella vectensis TaxID=45351 RepID=A7RWF4_NEMVE|nr:predicted protein [Nematostella vectensis]|eukprot:XP_001636313.1 predicted protein [Nematostella vectensis]
MWIINLTKSKYPYLRPFFLVCNVTREGKGVLTQHPQIDLFKDDCRGFLKDLEALNSSIFSKTDALNVTLLKKELSTFVEGLKHKSYLMPFSNLEGQHLELARTIGWMKCNDLKDFEKLFSRLEAIPCQISQFIDLMKEGIKTQRLPPRITVNDVPGQIQSFLDLKFEDSSKLFMPFKNIPESFTEKERQFIKGKVSLIEDTVKPVFRQLQTFFTEEYLPACRESIALTELPGGKDYYQQCLDFHLTCHMSPEEIHQVGLREVERIRTRMAQVAKETGFKGTLDQFISHLREDRKHYFKDKEDLLKGYRHLCFNIITPLLPKLFKNLPKATFEICEVPEESAPNFPGAFYLAPPEDGSRPGTFMVNTYKHEERPKFEMPSLALHEAVPGHHLQAAVALESEKQPSFRRNLEDRLYYLAPGRFAINTGYVEGWGLYCEYLGEELKLYTDPYDIWSRDQAVEFMTKTTAMSVHDVNAEVTRYITWPGQACGYKIGELKILELREKARKELGEKFDIRDFHEVFLSLGPVPLAVLEDAVSEYIKSTKFGRLSHEMLRSCRLVVDTGMHVLGWSRDQAVEFMTKNTAMSVHDVNAEVTRYITWPGQACGYKIGELKILELREKARKELGEKFDIRDFHEVFLSLGPVPLAVLEDAVSEYIKSTK